MFLSWRAHCVSDECYPCLPLNLRRSDIKFGEVESPEFLRFHFLAEIRYLLNISGLSSRSGSHARPSGGVEAASAILPPAFLRRYEISFKKGCSIFPGSGIHNRYTIFS